MDLRQQQIQTDNAKSNSQIGKIYYVKCPNDSRYYRTVRIHRNIFTGNHQTQVSNEIYGTPPDGMPEIPPLMRTKLQSMNNMTPYTY